MRLSIPSRIGRWRLQSAVDEPWFHANVPLLEGASSPAVGPAERIPNVRYAAVVEHCQRFARSSRDAHSDVLKTKTCDSIDTPAFPMRETR